MTWNPGGNNILAAGIETNADNSTKDDYRRQRYEVSIWPYELSPNLAQQCRTLVSKAGLKYAGIDLIITPEGRVVFLELGPYSSWVWVEKKSGLPITSMFVDLLLELEDSNNQEVRDETS